MDHAVSDVSSPGSGANSRGEIGLAGDLTDEERENLAIAASVFERIAVQLRKAVRRDDLPCVLLHMIDTGDLDDLRALSMGSPAYKVRQQCLVVAPNDMNESYRNYIAEVGLPMALLAPTSTAA